tara:strand:+ start:898 stop:1371 length:474 start_codon:yes stop_codon:yes gene_type:complete
MAYKKKYSGAQTLSNFLPDEVKKILKKRGFAELELLKNWGNIVPKKYVSLIYPIKIKANSQKEGARLVLKVDPSIAFAVEHEKEKIIQKINSFFGYQAILKLELIQEKIQHQDGKLSNNNKLLKDKTNVSNRYSKELIEYPELKKNFQKIASKIEKN